MKRNTINYKGGKERFSVEEVAEALRKNGGLRKYAAKALGCGYTTVGDYMERHPELEDVVKEARDNTIDIAEQQLFKKMKDGNMTAIIFFLKCQAKDRGYVERTELAGVADKPITLNIMPARVKRKPRETAKTAED